MIVLSFRSAGYIAYKGCQLETGKRGNIIQCQYKSISMLRKIDLKVNKYGPSLRLGPYLKSHSLGTAGDAVMGTVNPGVAQTNFFNFENIGNK